MKKMYKYSEVQSWAPQPAVSEAAQRKHNSSWQELLTQPLHGRPFSYTSLISQVVQKEISNNPFPRAASPQQPLWPTENGTIPCPVALLHPWQWGLCSPWVQNWVGLLPGWKTGCIFNHGTPNTSSVSLSVAQGAPRDRFPSEDSHSTTSEQELASPKFSCLCIYTHGKVTVIYVGRCEK